MDKVISPDRSRTASRTVSRDSFMLEDLNEFGENSESAMNNLIYGSSKIPIDFESFRRSNEDFQVVRQVHSFDSMEFRDKKQTISLQKQQQFSNSPKKFGESLASESTATIGDDYDVNSKKHVINLLPKESSKKEDPMKSFSPTFPLLRAYSDDTHQSGVIYNTDSIDSTATEHQFELGVSQTRKTSSQPKEEYIVNEQFALQADIEMFNSNDEKRGMQQQNSFLLSSEFDEQRPSGSIAGVEQRDRKNSFNNLSGLRQASPVSPPGLNPPRGQDVIQRASSYDHAQPIQRTGSYDHSQPIQRAGSYDHALSTSVTSSFTTSTPQYGSGAGVASFSSNQFQEPSPAASYSGVSQQTTSQYNDSGRYDQASQQQNNNRYNPAPVAPQVNRQQQQQYQHQQQHQHQQYSMQGQGAPSMEYDSRAMNYGNPQQSFRPPVAPMPQSNHRGGYNPSQGGMAPAPQQMYGQMQQQSANNRYMTGPPQGSVMGLPVPNARLGPYVSPLNMGPPPAAPVDRYVPQPNYQPRVAPMTGQFQPAMSVGGGPQGYYGGHPAGPAAMQGMSPLGSQYGMSVGQYGVQGAGAAPYASGPYVSPFNGLTAAGPYGMLPQQPSYPAAGFGGPGVGMTPLPQHSPVGAQGGGGGGGGNRGKYGYGANRATNTNNLISAGLYDGTGTVYVVQLKCQYRHYVLDARAPQYLKTGDFVIVDADRGEDLGIIIELLPMMAFIERQRMLHISLDDEQNEVGRILRQASMYEREQLPGKYQDELLVIETTEQLAINTYHMQMIVVDADYQFDRQKLTIYYDSAIRVDFRELVRDLFATFKTRIWFKKANNRYFKAKQYAVMGLATGVSPSDISN